MTAMTNRGERWRVASGVFFLVSCGAVEMDAAAPETMTPAAEEPAAPVSGGAAQAALAGKTDCAGVSWTAQVKPFAERYCIRCHTTPLIARPGEMKVAGLDDEPAWLEHGLHAMEMIELGFMPLGAPFPTADEVARLGRWLACEEGVRPHDHD